MANKNINIYSPYTAATISLRACHGWRGYGIYCAILNHLELQPSGVWPANYKELSYQLMEEEEIVCSVVEDFGLFGFEEREGKRYFYVEALREESLRRAALKEKRAAAAAKRWGSRKPVRKEEPKREDAFSGDAGIQTEKGNEGEVGIKAWKGNEGEERSTSGNGEYNLLERPEVLTENTGWLMSIAQRERCSQAVLMRLFGLFMQNQKTTGGGSYPTVRDAQIHFNNWLLKKYAKEQKSYLRREEEKEMKARADEEHDKQAISYDEYLRRRK